VIRIDDAPAEREETRQRVAGKGREQQVHRYEQLARTVGHHRTPEEQASRQEAELLNQVPGWRGHGEAVRRGHVPNDDHRRPGELACDGVLQEGPDRERHRRAQELSHRVRNRSRRAGAQRERRMSRKEERSRNRHQHEMLHHVGVFDSGDRHVVIDPNVRDRSFRDMDDLMIASSASGTPVRLRDLATLSRGYESPPRFLNYLVARDPDGRWQRNRAVTIAIQMRSGQQIGQFGAAVDQALQKLRPKFPPDLTIARTSDQPRQVKENIDLFMVSLYEAIGLVVIVSLFGFWSWRTALLVATSIPLTIAMSFGAMLFLGVDLQQVSIATLIIALGLLVDMPVVAGDAIQRELAEGTPRDIAAWIGPTRLVRAIVFATLTNIVAYLPFLALSGDTGRFLHSLPIVMTVNLVRRARPLTDPDGLSEARGGHTRGEEPIEFARGIDEPVAVRGRRSPATRIGASSFPKHVRCHRLASKEQTPGRWELRPMRSDRRCRDSGHRRKRDANDGNAVGERPLLPIDLHVVPKHAGAPASLPGHASCTSRPP
jgi:AcrB/AcrD/AcrF family